MANRLIQNNRFFAVLCLLLSGCGSTRQRIVRMRKEPPTITQCEAKWDDIPLPLDGRLEHKKIKESIDGIGCHFNFTIPKDLNQGVYYFTQEMEKYGWQQMTMITFVDGATLVYEKPSRCAVINLEEKKGLSVDLFVGQKKKARL